MEEINPNRRQLFVVRQTEVGSKTAEVLKELDLILTVNGNIVTRVHELDISPDWSETAEMVDNLQYRRRNQLATALPQTS